MSLLKESVSTDVITIRRKGNVLFIHPHGSPSLEQWKRAILLCAWDQISVNAIWYLRDIDCHLTAGEFHALTAVRSRYVPRRGYQQRFLVASEADGNILSRAFSRLERARWEFPDITIVSTLEEIPLLQPGTDARRWPRVTLL